LVWDEQTLIGVLPLARVREPLARRPAISVSVLTNAGTGIGTDHAGWLALDGADELLAKWTVGRGGVFLRGVPPELGEKVGGRLLDTEVCPRIRLDELSERMSSKLAKTLRNASRRLEDEGVEFRWKSPGQVRQSDLDHLYALHARRRSETGDKPIFDDPTRRQFHNSLLSIAVDRTGGTAVMTAEREGEVVGVLYGFVWGNAFAYYQIGWEPAYHRLSLGSVLVLESMKACADAGFEVYDFLRGAETYKYRFGATDVTEGSFAVGRSPSLGLLRAANRARQLRSRRAQSS
jgi:hypothetical protein